MNPENLQLGDIIIFHAMDEQAEHAAMFSGYRDGFHWVIHTATGGIFEGLKESVLRPLKNEFYTVFRCQDSTLAATACEQLKAWAKYEIPYDQQRARLMHLVADCQTHLRNPQTYLKYAIEQNKSHFWHMVKFAARRDVSPVNELQLEHKRGLQCIQALILAFQVAEIRPFVKTITELGNRWVSNKHIVDIDGQAPESFSDHAAAVNDSEEYPDFNLSFKRKHRDENTFIPSHAAWNHPTQSADDFFGAHPLMLPLDAKITGPELFVMFLRQSQKFTSLGKLNVGPVTFTDVQKELHRSNSSLFLAQATKLKGDLIQKLAQSAPTTPTSPLSCFGSPTSSPLPRQDYGNNS